MKWPPWESKNFFCKNSSWIAGFSRCSPCFFTELSQTFIRWVRTGMHAVSKVSEPTIDLIFSCSKPMRESNQTKVLAVQLWRWQPQSLLYLLLSRNMGLKNNQGLNACQFPWRTGAVYSSPARLFDLHALSFGRCGSLVRALFQIHRH